jgi:hypothetical protein
MTMTSDATHFWATLMKTHPQRVRFSRADLLEAFGQAFPHSQGDLNQRERLAAILRSLAEAGYVRLPRESNRRGYDHSERTPLPRFVNRLNSRKAIRKATYWRPELAFAQNLPGIWHEELVAIQNWLRKRGGETQYVALRERSVEIFGDEKRLDGMLGTKLFAGGRLSLDLLKCYLPTVPIYVEAIETDQHVRPLLVIENHTTFDTIRRWNQHHKRYSAVAFGSGTAFISSCSSLRPNLQQQGCSGVVLYFGDVDPKGLWIPVRSSQESGIEIRPERTLYELLFRKARDRFIVARDPFPFEADLLEWLPQNLREEAAQCFNRGRRLPQEFLSICDLGVESQEPPPGFASQD